MTSAMYILGVDFGEKRIGLAVSNKIAQIPHPLKTILNQPDVLEEIASIVESEDIGRVVVGLPRNMDGTLGRQAEVCREFGEALAARLKKPVVFTEETLSSVQASELQRQYDPKVGLDAVAAVCILERYFEEERSKHGLAS